MAEYILRSPNELLHKAAESMDVQGDWQTWDRLDWAKIVNCWAFNLPAELAAQEIKLLRMIHDIPLSNDEVNEIVNYQLTPRRADVN